MRTNRRLIFALLAMLTLSAPLVAQEVLELGSLLSGKSYPLSMKLKDLDADWRRMTVRGGANVSGNLSVNVNGYTSSSSANNSSSASHSQNNFVGALPSSHGYVTKGQTVGLHGRTYLVAYHLPAFGVDVGALLQALAAKTAPSAAVLSPESTLPLSLLDLQSVGNLDDIRIFDMQGEIAESEKAIRLATELFKSQSGGSSTNSRSSAKDEGEK